ncbi:MAG: KTSC domain-containing protein [Alphaproteobacteria bacterium]|nr:KTSC domain-containing protein [Alphaproteobacteria bacterium]
MEQRTSVVSSNIKSVGFDSASQILEIEFHSGGIYQYFNVPAEIYNGIMNAPSKGKFFHQFIRGNYEFIRIK